MLAAYHDSDAIVLGIPAGGIPVAATVAAQLGLALDVAVVSKITLPWNTEAGYGAVAFDGTVILNQELLPRLGLSKQEIADGVSRTKRKVERRVRRLRGARRLPDLARRTLILIDDGLASGFTMRVAVEALRRADAREVVVAVPTAHRNAVERLAGRSTTIYCANLRGGFHFAVADAYQYWYDVDESELVSILARFADR